MQIDNYFDYEPFEICSIRPPTENSSLTFRLTRNCYWNKCAFCPVYKTGSRFSKRTIEDLEKDILRAKKIDSLLADNGISGLQGSSYSQSSLYSLIADVKRARYKEGLIPSLEEKSNDLEDSPDLDERMRWFLTWFKDKPTTEDSFTHVYSWRMAGGRTCFFGDADSLVLKPEFIARACSLVKESFPSINRITVYGRTKSAAKVRTLKVKEAGISCSVYVMPGLGGRDLSEDNAVETARVLSRIAPDFVRLRTLEIFPGTGLDVMKRTGSFVEASEEDVVREIRTLVSETSCETDIVSDSATNLLVINGCLPYDRDKMLRVIDSYLALSQREKIEFSVKSRIESFMGQYGGLTDDIYVMLSPYIQGGRLNIENAGDETLIGITNSIRSKLMP